MGTKTVLGLDLGTSSIGWAIVSVETKEAGSDGRSSLEDADILKLGVRIFPEPVNPKTNTLLNKERRTKRGGRKLIARRRRRTLCLLNALKDQGLIKRDISLKQLGEKIGLTDPYGLRVKALEEKCTPEELGMALFHLAQRRGFKSNRKGGGKDTGDLDALSQQIEELKQKKKEAQKQNGAFLKADEENLKEKEQEKRSLEAVQGEFKEAQRLYGVKTVGAWLSRLKKEGEDIKTPATLRRRALLRKDIEAEFHAIVEAQKNHYPKLYTDREKLAKIIFTQRPLKDNSHLISFCELEPKERCVSRAHIVFEEFSFRQDFANLKFERNFSAGAGEREIELRKAYPDYIDKLIERLIGGEDITPEKIQKECNISTDQYTVNMARSKKGWKSETASTFLKTLGTEHTPIWKDAGRRADLMALVFGADAQKKEAEKRLKEVLTEEKIALCRDIDIPKRTKYASLSLKAVEKMLGRMREGLSYPEAQKELYEGQDRPSWDKDYLPSLIEWDLWRLEKTEAFKKRGKGPTKEKYVPSITNGTVVRALTELGKLINDLRKNHTDTPFEEIVVETSRQVGLSAEKRGEIKKNIDDREKENDKIRESLKAYGVGDPSRDDILKYKQIKKQKGLCAYCGKNIEGEALFSGVELDHIIPISAFPDDSQENKVAACRDCNQEKKERTPFEAFKGRPQWVYIEKIYPQTIQIRKQRSSSREEAIKYTSLPSKTLHRILTGSEHTDRTVESYKEGFATRQLNDTGYIAKKVIEYLQLLYKNRDNPHKKSVNSIKGGATALLRKILQCDDLLYTLEMPPKDKKEAGPPEMQDESGESSQSQSGEALQKKNRFDHRHHAIDAVMIALSSPALVQRIELHAQAQTDKKSEEWEDTHRRLVKYFGNNLAEKLRKRIMELTDPEELTISHRTNHKLKGALHEETVLGVCHHLAINHITPSLVKKLKDQGYITAQTHQKILDFYKDHGQEDPTYRTLVQYLLHTKEFLKIPLEKPLYIKRVPLSAFEDVKELDSEKGELLLPDHLRKKIKTYLVKKQAYEAFEKQKLAQRGKAAQMEAADFTKAGVVYGDVNLLPFLPQDQETFSYEAVKKAGKAFSEDLQKGLPKRIKQLAFENNIFSPQNAPYKALEYGNNHHHCLYYKKGRHPKTGEECYQYAGFIVPTLHAAELVRKGVTKKALSKLPPLVGRKGSPYLGGPGIPLNPLWMDYFGRGKNSDYTGYKFLCHLHGGDLVSWDGEDPEAKGIFRYVASSNLTVILAYHLTGDNPHKRTGKLTFQKGGRKRLALGSTNFDPLKAILRISPSGRPHRVELKRD